MSGDEELTVVRDQALQADRLRRFCLGSYGLDGEGMELGVSGLVRVGRLAGSPNCGLLLGTRRCTIC